MRVIGVLDILGGVVVRGQGGHRELYRPMVSTLLESVDPMAVARRFRDLLGIEELYLADLDAIMGGEASHRLYGELSDDGFVVWIDAGLKRSRDAEHWMGPPGVGCVAGLETLESPAELRELVERWGTQAVVFSLDVRAGAPCSSSRWPTCVNEIVDVAARAGVTKCLYLDLERVGNDEGVAGIDLVHPLRARTPAIECWLGGGARSAAELHRLREHGVQAVLVASALHDGNITPAQLEPFLLGSANRKTSW